MKRNTLSAEQAQRLASTFRRRRAELGLSAREVARRVGVSHGTIEGLERGARLAPHPDILTRVGAVLGIPSSDLFASANWLATDELPSLQPYLRVKYGLGSQDAAAVDAYLAQLQARRGKSHGPANGEDEHL